VTRCDQCGFAYEEVAPDDVAGRLRAAPDRYRQSVANSSPQVVSTRPDPAVWSAIEYACHVRDVLLVQRDRAVVALVEDRPSFARMYRDERVALCGYGQQGMDDVLAQLAMAAELCVNGLRAPRRTGMVPAAGLQLARWHPLPTSSTPVQQIKHGAGCRSGG
jgi:hypothetical protein